MLHRGLARDYEMLLASSEPMIYSMSDNMTRRLTDTTTATWRDPVGARAAA
ncbi:MAG: Mobile element protein [Streptosporangiaceae bacterium]|nr:Mobile element protein [Streptosporangiaceae bacterium]